LEEVWSLTDVVKILDRIIGAYSKLSNNTVGEENTNAVDELPNTDKRPTNLLPNNRNIIDNLVTFGADIGAIEKLEVSTKNGGNPNSNRTNNLQFTTEKQNQDSKDIYSLTEAVILLDKIIGAYSKLENQTVGKDNETALD
jgi:hypothetical protein